MQPPDLKLNTGASIPSLGLGTWQSKPTELEEAVTYAIDTVGYRLLDSAWGYGNEIPLGNALQRCKTPREQMFVTVHHFLRATAEALRGLRDSLAKLKLDYVDLYLMHWPVPVPPTEENYPLLPNGDRHILHEDQWSYIDTWKEMEKLLKDGKCKAIGVSNMSIPFLKRLMAECQVVPAVNQIECHPLLPQEELVKYCHDKGIVVQAYSPLGSVNSPLLVDPDIQRIARIHGASPSQVIISWLVARGIVVLPKSVTPSRIKENFDIISLSAEEIETLSTYAETHGGPKRFIDPPWGCSLGFTDGFGERKLSQIQFRSFPHVSEIIPPDN